MLIQRFRKALATNSTATAFVAKLPTATMPSGTGVFDLGLSATGQIVILPYGTTTNDTTFDVRLWGWSQVEGLDLWVPDPILHLSCILGTSAGTAIGASVLMCDTIAVTKGPADNGPWRMVSSPADNTLAVISCQLRGSQLLEFDFDLTGAVSANCLWKLASVE